MSQTFFQLDLLNSTDGLATALLIGIVFGICLEISGFGSSKILAGVFYFRDLRVAKVMTSAIFTAMLGLLLCQKFGVVLPGSIHILPTFYLASIVGGLIFGIGFVAGAWCPGTALVGMVSGKIDAWIFVFGSMLGVGGYALFYPGLKQLYKVGDAGQVTLFDLVNSYWLSGIVLVCGMILLLLAESWNEEKFKFEFSRIGQNRILILLLLTFTAAWSCYTFITPKEKICRMAEIAAAIDHISCNEVVDLLMKKDESLLLIDIRPEEEYKTAHIPGAKNIPLEKLEIALNDYRNRGVIVLYSNGMTHPAQAQEILQSRGYRNIFILTDGFSGFMEQIAKPLSLRVGPVTEEDVERFQWWQQISSEDGGNS